MFYREIIAVFPDPRKTQNFTVTAEGRNFECQDGSRNRDQWSVRGQISVKKKQ